MQDIKQVSGLRSQVSGLRSQVSGLRSQVSGLRSIVCNDYSRVEIVERAKGIVARFFVALLMLLFTIPCQADTPLTSVMQKAVTQQIAPGSNLSLVSKGFESVVRDMGTYLDRTVKEQIPPGDIRDVVQQQKGLLLEMDGDIVDALSEEGKRLKSEGSSADILERHEEFVRRYRQNMDGLLTALERIVEADEGRLSTEIEAAQTFVSRLIPTREIQEPYPSLPQPPANVPSIQLPVESVTIDEMLHDIEKESGKKQLAPSLQAAPVDESALLAETPDIQLTPEIKALAKELGHSPVKIFEWVYNNIDYTPYYGSFKGSQHTLLEKSGNDWDTCSLLMALLRASNVPCQYVRGVICMDIETAKNWIGVKNAQTACDILYYSGYPIVRLLDSDRQTLLGFSSLEHVIVEACLPYGNYRGAQNDPTEKIWIPLDPSFKEYEYTEGNLNARDVTFATSTYYAKVQELSPIEYHKVQITGNLDEMRLTRQIKQKRFEFLSETLPYYGRNKDKNNGVYYPYCVWRGRLDTLNSLEERHRFRILAGAGYSEIEASLSFPNAYGKRLILSYEPAADEDKKAIDEGHFYLAKFKSTLRLDGEKIAEGKKELTANDIGGSELAGIYPIYPVPRERDVSGNGAMGTVTKFTSVVVGGCHAFIVDANGDTDRLIQERMERIMNNIGEKGSGLVDEGVIGEVLHITGLRYFNECEKQARDIASLNHYYYRPDISSAILSQQISPIVLAGNVTGVELTNEIIDAELWDEKYADFLCAVEGAGDKNGENLATLIGANGSYFEHRVLEDTFDVPAVSTVKIIQLANEQGIPVRYITSENISVLDGMNIPNVAKKDIRNSLNDHPEQVVIIPEKELEYHDWVGIGYIVWNTRTGDGRYMISGCLQGGMTAEACERALWEELPVDSKNLEREKLIKDALDLISKETRKKEEFIKDILDLIIGKYGKNSYKFVKAMHYIQAEQWGKLIQLLDPTPKEYKLIMKYLLQNVEEN